MSLDTTCCTVVALDAGAHGGAEGALFSGAVVALDADAHGGPEGAQGGTGLEGYGVLGPP